jgi:hypothetical protein
MRWFTAYAVGKVRAARVGPGERGGMRRAARSAAARSRSAVRTPISASTSKLVADMPAARFYGADDAVRRVRR